MQRADSFYQIYRKAGIWLKNNSSETANVGVLTAGIIGFYSERAIIDFAGLLQPEIANFIGPQTTYEDSTLYAIQIYSPDYIVLAGDQWERVEVYVSKLACLPTKILSGKKFGYPQDIVILQCP